MSCLLILKIAIAHDANVCIGLIAGRIAWTRYETRKVTTYAPIGRSYWSIVDILVQSAAITACAFAALLGTYWAQSNAHFLIIEAIPPLIVSSLFFPLRCSLSI